MIPIPDVNPTVICKELDKKGASHSVGEYIRYRIVNQYLPPGSGPCIDAGCGSGPFLEWIKVKGYEPLGLDLHKCNDDPRIVEGSMLAMPWPDNFASAIVSIDSFYVDPLEAFTEFRRVLKPGGIIVMHCPLPSPKRGGKMVQTHILEHEFDEAKKIHAVLVEEFYKDPKNQPKGTYLDGSPGKERLYTQTRQWFDTGELAAVLASLGFENIEEFPCWNPHEILAYDIAYLYRLLHPTEIKETEIHQQLHALGHVLAAIPCEKPWSGDYHIGLITRCNK